MGEKKKKKEKRRKVKNREKREEDIMYGRKMQRRIIVLTVKYLIDRSIQGLRPRPYSLKLSSYAYTIRHARKVIHGENDIPRSRVAREYTIHLLKNTIKLQCVSRITFVYKQSKRKGYTDESVLSVLINKKKVRNVRTMIPITFSHDIKGTSIIITVLRVCM